MCVANVTIAFGPVEDRFHRQLAIDARVDYDLSQDSGFLDVAPELREHGVRGSHSREFLCRVRRNP